ncbi:MAG: MotA/TolQ/ExbB proton channel family protein [Gammaproteobacteria bacterium]|nr:MotA/TolQ/ExbB proton channel family protein [Gammaproteobacteria bacterium]
MRKLILVAIGIALTAPVATSAFAAPRQNGVNSPTELLGQIKAEVQGKSALFKKHRAAFAAASPEQQQAMMKQAQSALEKAKTASEKTANQFIENSAQVTEITNKLHDKVSALKLMPVFALARKAASNTATVFQGSLIATQLEPPKGEPNRLEFLYMLANEDSTPTIAQLERLWYELQRGLTAQGQVVRYQTSVVDPDGTSAVQSVLRIGPFTASSGGRFLNYIPALKTLSILPRPLPGEFGDILYSFTHSNKEYARAVVDSSGGALMIMMINSPSWLQRIDLGGTVGYVIIIVGIIGLILFLFQLVRLIIVRIGVSRQLKNIEEPKKDNPLGRVLLAHKGDPDQIEEDYELAELRLTEAVLHEEPKLTRFQNYLRLAVAAGPLLGLIGTVVGMIITFQTITETGSADPRLMATGIGHAMIATVLGLAIAIPLLFANALLHSLSDGLLQNLEKQSAGFLAEGIERERKRRRND